jgi:hypothetical protein
MEKAQESPHPLDDVQLFVGVIMTVMEEAMRVTSPAKMTVSRHVTITRRGFPDPKIRGFAQLHPTSALAPIGSPNGFG